MVVAIAAASPGVRAQDENETDAEAEAEARALRRALIYERQFDVQIFGGESPESVRARLNNVVNERVGRLDRQYRLTDAQKEKLLLAGLGDIKRAFDRVDDLRRRFQLVKYEHNGVIECLQEARRMHIDLRAGIFGVDSLFTKTIATTITQEQKANEEKVHREYDAARYPRSADEVAARLVRVLNLSPEQHQRLKKLLRDEVRPPRRLGESLYAYIMYQLSRVPEDRVRPIFSDSQWTLLHQFLVGWSSARPFLEHDGFVFDDYPATRWRIER